MPTPCVNFDLHPRDWYSDSIKPGWTHLNRTHFQTVFANDILDAAEAAWKAFFRQRDPLSSSLFTKRSIVDLVKEHQAQDNVFPDNIDVVTGGFPCQDFSVGGNRGGFQSHKNHNNQILDDIPREETRGQLYLWMRSVIEITDPKVFIAENVKGLVSLGDAKSIIENDFRNIGEGYLVVPARVLMAGNYGVAQKRERVIFIGLNRRYLKSGMAEKIEEGEVDIYPPITHAQNPTGNQKPLVLCRLVLADLLEPEQSRDKAQQAYSKAKKLAKGQGQ